MHYTGSKAELAATAIRKAQFQFPGGVLGVRGANKVAFGRATSLYVMLALLSICLLPS